MNRRTLTLTATQAAALHAALRNELHRLSMIEDHDPDRAKAARAVEEASTLLEVLDQLRAPQAA